jgi:hypothetical protein
MLDGYLYNLLREKWINYVKLRYFSKLIVFIFFIFKVIFRFSVELIFFMIYFVLCSVSLILKRKYFDHLVHDSNCIISNNHYSKLNISCKCAYLNPDDSSRYVINFDSF